MPNPPRQSGSTARIGRAVPHAMPVVAMALVVVLLGAFLWLLQRNEREEEALALIKDALWIEQNLHFQLASDEDKLERLAEALGRTEVDLRQFAAMARLVVNTNPAIERVLWLDAQGRTLLAEPPLTGKDRPGNGGAEGADAEGGSPDGTPRDDAVRIARSTGLRAYGAPYRIDATDRGFDAAFPLFRDGVYAGALVGVFSFEAMLTHHVPWWFAQRYQLEVIDATGTVLGSKSRMSVPGSATGSGAGPAPDPARSHVIPFDPPGHGLALVATAYPTDSNVTRTVLVAAIFALTGSALWSLWSLRRHIAGRLRAEEALREEHAFRKAMEDSLTVGMRARDLDGRITYVNPAFCRMVGLEAEELVGRGPPMPYWLPEEIDQAEAALQDVLAGRAPESGLEMRFRRANGERFEALIYEAPLIDANGRQTGWMGSVLDITERKRAEELARQQQERLQQTSRLITMGEMASTLAHELNQPLSAIASYCTGCLNRLRSDRCDTQEVAAALEKLAAQAKRAGLVVRRIHDFVRKRDPKVAPCSLAEVLEDCVGLAGSDAARLGVRVELDAPADLPLVTGDRILLQQVVLNLMRNGIEAMARTPRPGRRLTVTVRQTGGENGEEGGRLLLTEIRDHGCGIAPEVADRLFSPFFTTKREGMGMGLNICRSIVEHHRGRLWFETATAEGEAEGGGPEAVPGTRFLFTLPVHAHTPDQKTNSIPDHSAEAAE
ncbi:two-component system sensor histidine kinase DctS [Azospirillum lipoferum]|uniref:histidine kinase n=1 Tax=Azospirillum lipoferum TaxID=193 RepID=A0A5A9GS23_AZOLI|nr:MULTISPECIES: PAS domain S-box protein [Azospirillum]KAA0597136.1 PAS domain S-box protein [Azospirillum lipoferum]MCP1608633.1 two-component system sensor histidine kinase DctS [Azospirillum lipoferum]MDW5536049.1 PAS domain S-box protein [Azospirillum sp. NL1]